jgi:hypothetical protein
MGASANPTGAGCRGITQLYTVPRPLNFTISRRVL